MMMRKRVKNAKAEADVGSKERKPLTSMRSYIIIMLLGVENRVGGIVEMSTGNKLS